MSVHSRQETTHKSAWYDLRVTATRTGSANLPLHGGRVPPWLSARMAKLGRVIVEALVLQYGQHEVLRRLSHPFWFQSFGAVMGMDWHSSGITTSVLGALKRGLAPVQHELGIYVCGGKGAQSRKTPMELVIRASRLVAKVDSAAVQDGFELYLHGFIATTDGHWCVVQQGMNGVRREARRYHWLSEHLQSFIDSPHAAIEGRNQGAILNLADARAKRNRLASMELVAAGPERPISVLRRLVSPAMPLFHSSPRRRLPNQHRTCNYRRITRFAHLMLYCAACTRHWPQLPNAVHTTLRISCSHPALVRAPLPRLHSWQRCCMARPHASVIRLASLWHTAAKTDILFQCPSLSTMKPSAC